MNIFVFIVFAILFIALGASIMGFILSKRYENRWHQEYIDCQKYKLLNYETMVTSKELLLSYLNSMETMWLCYERMYDTFKQIKENFDYIERYPVEGKETLLPDIIRLVDSRLKENVGVEETFTRILGLDTDKINIWMQDCDVHKMVPHGESYLRTTKQIDEMNEEIEKMKKLLGVE